MTRARAIIRRCFWPPEKPPPSLEAGELFTSGIDYLEISDEAHSDTEDRFIAIGPIRWGLVVIVWTERDEHNLRILSARWATRRKRALYVSTLEPKP